MLFRINYLKSATLIRDFNFALKINRPSIYTFFLNLLNINFIVLSFYPPLCFKRTKVFNRFNFVSIFKLNNKLQFLSGEFYALHHRKRGVYNVPRNNLSSSLNRSKWNYKTRLKGHLRYVSSKKRNLKFLSLKILGSLETLLIFKMLKIHLMPIIILKQTFLKKLIDLNREIFVNEKSILLFYPMLFGKVVQIN